MTNALMSVLAVVFWAIVGYAVYRLHHRYRRWRPAKPKAPKPAPTTCTKVYRSAGQFKRGVEKMARNGWVVQSQSSATPGRVGLPGMSSGWTKTLVVFRLEDKRS